MLRMFISCNALVLGAFIVISCSHGDSPKSPSDDDRGGGAADWVRAPSGTEEGVIDDESNKRTFALFVGTNFRNAELSVFSFDSGSIVGRRPLEDQDSVAWADRGFGWVLERGIGKALALDRKEPWTVSKTIDLNDTPDAARLASNPHAIVVTTGTKAYVARYGVNSIKIFNASSGALGGTIDLSEFQDPRDPDGRSEVQDAVYDPATKRAYFLLERIHVTPPFPPPDYLFPCLAWPPQVVAVDATNDHVIDLNGPAPGRAIDLLGDNPDSITLDAETGRLIVADIGCYVPQDGGANVRRGRGVEAIALGTGTPSWLLHATGIQRFNGLVWVDPSRAFLSYGNDWFAWNPTQPVLGPVLPNFPRAPFYDGENHIIGLSVVTNDASAPNTSFSAVSWNLANAHVTTLATHVFQSVVPHPLYGISSAYLHKSRSGVSRIPTFRNVTY
ncbi:hypothetical protein [Pendulispora albinea]|uniref:Uncharacterized protein n=1 Tax=Pendulispora albinea TaxID=2741071 RepID=A0ABZ2LZL9_9BACT